MEKKYMIKKSDEFAKARKKGKTFRNRQFTLNRCSNDLPHSRFGFIITKKVGKATVRNKLRRQLKALVRERIHHLDRGFDYILIPKPHTADLTFQEIEKNLDHLFNLAKKDRRKRR